MAMAMCGLVVMVGWIAGRCCVWHITESPCSKKIMAMATEGIGLRQDLQSRMSITVLLWKEIDPSY